LRPAVGRHIRDSLRTVLLPIRSAPMAF